MKRGFLILVVALALGLGAMLVTRYLCLGSPSTWLCREYGLSGQKVCRVETLEKEYGSRCGPYCDEMCEANARLRQLALSSECITPAIRDAVAETDRIRTATRITMLEHFYAVAAELPPEKRAAYLLKVLPLVIEPCGSR
jgi:hypothetical protein